MNNKLSAIIITKDEAQNITGCLGALKFANETIVVDTGSSDNTIDLARAGGADVYQTDWQGFGHGKSFALKKATGEWVLSVDADEIITDDLAKEIKSAIEKDNYNGFEIPRRTNFLGKWIRHSGWYPDYVLRLFKKESGHFTDSTVHEKVIVDGPIGKLKNPLLHYSYPDMNRYLRKLETYTDLASKQMYEKGKRFSFASLLFKPAGTFCRHFIFRAGFLDGIEGFMIACLSSYGKFIRLIKLRQLEKSNHA